MDEILKKLNCLIQTRNYELLDISLRTCLERRYVYRKVTIGWGGGGYRADPYEDASEPKPESDQIVFLVKDMVRSCLQEQRVLSLHQLRDRPLRPLLVLGGPEQRPAVHQPVPRLHHLPAEELSPLGQALRRCLELWAGLELHAGHWGDLAFFVVFLLMDVFKNIILRVFCCPRNWQNFLPICFKWTRHRYTCLML
jgi:hypothetical protein